MRFLCILVLLTGGLAAEEVPDPRAEVLNQVRALAQQFDRFEDKAVAAEALTLLGSVTCRYDQPVASDVLTSAASALSTTELEPKPYEQLRARLVRSAAACDKSLVDPLLEATLSDKVSPTQAALSSISAASSQIRQDPSRAVEIARPGLQATTMMTNDEARRVGWFLSMLRTEDAAAANSLYLETLAIHEAAPDSSLASLQAMGNYVFGPPDSEGVYVTSVGGATLADLSRQREGVPDEVAAAYLQTVAGLLATPVSSPVDQSYRYVLSSQLAPHADRLAPELAATFRGLVEQTRAVLPSEVTAEAAKRLGRTREELMAQSPTKRSGDGGLLMRAGQHWRAGQFDEALAVASEIEDDDARTRMERVVALGRALRLASEGDANTAAAVAAKLEPGLYRTLAFLCLSARQHLEDGLPEDAISSLAIARVEADKLDVKAKPFIMLAVAKLEASLDPESALTTLGVAVTAFNELDEQPSESAPKPGEPRKSRTFVMGSGVSESLTADRAFSTIRIRPDRVDGYSFAKALPAFADAAPERLEAILANLRDERRLAEAKCAAIELRLARVIGGRPESE